MTAVFPHLYSGVPSTEEVLGLGLGVIFLVMAVFALIPAAIASHKGHSFWLWWFFGWMMFLVAFPASFLISEREERWYTCPRCSKHLQRYPCPHCGTRGIY